MIKLLQDPELLFQEHQLSNPNEHTSEAAYSSLKQKTTSLGYNKTS